MSTPRKLRDLPDTLTAFFLRWDGEHTRLMLAAISRFFERRAPIANDELLLLEQVVPIPPLTPDDTATTTWVDAMRRFALPTPALAAAGDVYEAWVGALWLGAVAMSISAQELMFADRPASLFRLRRSRMPRSATLARFWPHLTRELDAFRARDYSDPGRFVRQGRAMYCYGVAESSFLPPPLPRPVADSVPSPRSEASDAMEWEAEEGEEEGETRTVT